MIINYLTNVQKYLISITGKFFPSILSPQGILIFDIIMKDKVNKKRKFFQKLKNPYLVMIIDEETFEEKGQIRTSRFKTILVSFLLICISSSLIFTIISYTSLKEYIPGYDSSEIRAKAIQNLFLTDSLIQLYDQNLKYLNSVKKVLTEDISLEEQSTLKEIHKKVLVSMMD